jgi:hypothetical protein
MRAAKSLPLHLQPEVDHFAQLSKAISNLGHTGFSRQHGVMWR